MVTEPTERVRPQRWQLVAAGVIVLLVAGGGVALALRPGAEPGPGATGAGEPSSSSSSSSSSNGSSSAPPSSSGMPTAAPTDGSTGPATGPATSPAPSPTGEAPRPSAAPVPLDEPAQSRPGVDVRLASIEKVEGVTTIPGEVGGPSLRVTVEVTNGTKAAVPLSAAVANLYFGPDSSPAISLMEPGSKAMPATVAPGATATGVWVFNVPEDQRSQVVVEFDLAVDATVVLFSGAVS
jgi:hypothetical protein